ncbi:MAG: S41 family peptidase [Candidatus Brocadiia bacterium]
MRRQLVVLMCTFILAVALQGALTAEKAKEPDAATRKAEALQIMADLEKCYVFFDLKGIRKDWEDSKKEWKKRAEKLPSDVELIDLVSDMIACLRDGHMGFSKLNVKMPEREGNFFSGLYFGEIDDKRVCIVNDASTLYGAAKPGAEVVEIDGKNARKWLDDASAALWKVGGSFSSPQRAAMMVWRWGLMGPKGEAHKITVLVNKQKSTFATENKYACRVYPETLPKVADLKETKDRDVRFKDLGDGIAYLWVRSLSGGTDGAIGEALGGLAGTKGVIVDISDNGGGGGYKLDSLVPFKGKVAVLISPRCFSAGETYARDLAKGCGARLFGATTAGSSSEKAEYELPRGLGSITYSTRSRSGITRNIEFYGIEPDERVFFDPSDLAKGDSTMAKAAVKWLKGVMK